MRLINADALKEKIRKEIKGYTGGSHLYTTGLLTAELYADELPTESATHGRWEGLPKEEWPFTCRCTACGNRSDEHSLFCGMCGAFMDDMHELLEANGHIVIKDGAAYEGNHN